MPVPATPLAARKRDAAYVAWFGVHLLIMFCVDLVPLYPAALRPAPLLQLRKWYIATYHDRFFIHPPAWFTAYAWMEAFYHVPLSVWAIYALVQDSPLVPLHLLVWAVQTVVTTLTCIVDYQSWIGLSDQDRRGLDGLYGPYLLLAVVMALDMAWRLHGTLVQHAKVKRS